MSPFTRVEPPRPWWWLSFVDPDRPTGEKFVGVCIVRGRDMVEAVTESHVLGLNPGGEVAGVELPTKPPVNPAWCNRLLTEADLLSLDIETLFPG